MRALIALLVAAGALTLPATLGGLALPAAVASPPVHAIADGPVHVIADSKVNVTVAPRDFASMDARGTLRLSVVVTNDTGLPIPAISATATAAGEPVAASLDMMEVLDTDPRGQSIAAGTTRVIELGVPGSSLPFTKSGVYEVDIAVTSAGDVIGTARTPVVWQSEASSPVRLVVAAPLVVPPTGSALLDAATLEQYTLPGGVLDRQLSDMAATSVAIGIDPRILASIRVLGSDAPPSAIEWLARLERVSNETFPLAWGDADLTSPLHAGAKGVLAPTSLDFAIDPARFTQPPDGEPSTATPTPVDDPAPVPGTDELIAWEYTLPELAWPAEGTVVNGDIVGLSEGGFSSAILHASDISRGGSLASRGSTATVDDLLTVTSETVLSRLLREAVAAPTEADWAAATAKLSAALATVSESAADQSPVLLATLDRSWSSTAYRLQQTLDAIISQPWVTTARLSDALAQAPVDGSLNSTKPERSWENRVRQLIGAEIAEQRFAGIAEDPAALTSPRRAALLSLLSNAWRGDTEAWREATSLFLDESDALLSSVQIVDSSTINLFNDKGALPVTVSNALDQPVTVYLSVRPQTAILAVENSRVELVIEPDSQRRGSVPVTSLSNGVVDVTVHLFSKSGSAIGEATEVKLNVQAGWETAGTVVAAGLVVVVFAVGLVRNIRKRRRAASD